MQLDGKVTAVVCGGASGMGAATVRALRALNVAVGIIDRDAAQGEIVASETGATFAEVDVVNEASVLRAFDQIRQKLGQERILVHTPAAGTMNPIAWRDPASGQIMRHSIKAFEHVLAVNLTGTFLCASVSAAGMMTLPAGEDGERGAIVMTSSIVSEDASAGISAYVASKAGINGMTLTLARDLGPEGIRVNTILPGSFDTPMNAPLPQSYKDQMIGWTVHPKRFGQAEEYASLALELMRNRYLNASLFRIDGGARA